MGPIQKAWVDSLDEHPELQMKESLGEGTPEDYTACCLGQFRVIACKILGEEPPFENYKIVDKKPEGYNNAPDDLLHGSWEELGLRSKDGKIEDGNIKIEYVDDEFEDEEFSKCTASYSTLAEANDGHATWADIAKFIRANPEKIFTKSV